jgi:hypothetical protein
MTISESKIWERWQGIGGRCECETPGHSHGDKCGNRLVFIKRDKPGPGGWFIRMLGQAEVNNGFRIYCHDCGRLDLSE